MTEKNPDTVTNRSETSVQPLTVNNVNKQKLYGVCQQKET